MSIRPVSTTMGVSSPASVGGGKYYRYNGDQPYRPPETSPQLPQNVKATSAKQKRMAEFTRLRLEGASKDQAAAEIGISSSTAGYYERDFQDRQRQEAAP